MISKFLNIIFYKIKIEYDLFLWKKNSKNVYKKSNINDSKSILICNLSTIIATSKFEALISNLFLNNNYKVFILLNKRNKIIEKIFSSVGEINFVFLDNYSNIIDYESINKKVNYIINHHLDDFINFEFENVRIGRNVLSKVVRHFRIGEIDKNNLDHLNYLRTVLANSLTTISLFNEFLKDKKFDKALFNERGYTPSGEIFDICLKKNIDVIQWISSPTPNCFSFKRYNINNRDQHPLSISIDGWNKLTKNSNIINESKNINDYYKELYTTDGTYNYQELNKGKKIVTERNAFLNSFGINNNNKIAVIFCHILYDATFFYGTSLFNNYQEWLIETIAIAIKNKNINWIIKVHPVNVWRSKMDGKIMDQLEKIILEKYYGKLPSHIIFMPADTCINTFSLFNNIDFGITVRGTVGMELPCFNVPVITAGTGRYNNHGFSIDPISKEEYFQILKNLHNISNNSLNFNSLNAQIFSYTTLNLRAIKVNYVNLKLNNIAFFTKKKEFILDVNKEFYKYGDKNLYSVFNWINNSSELEFINYRII
jgi:hypothetical protein